MRGCRYNIVFMIPTRTRGSGVAGDNHRRSSGQGRCGCVITAGGITRIHRGHGATPHSWADGVLSPQLGGLARVSIGRGRNWLGFQSWFPDQPWIVGGGVANIGMVTGVCRTTGGQIVRIVGGTELHSASGGPHGIDHTRAAGRYGSVTRSGTHLAPLQKDELRSTISDRGNVGFRPRKTFVEAPWKVLRSTSRSKVRKKNLDR